MKRPPQKPHFKRWLLAAVAATGLSTLGQTALDHNMTAPADFSTAASAGLSMPASAGPSDRTTTLTIGRELSAAFNTEGGQVTGHRALLPEDASRTGNDFLRMNDDQLLRSAALLDEPGIARYLIEKGADVHAKNDEALRLAAGTGALDTIRVLLEAGADPSANNGEALRNSVKRGHFDVAQYLVSKGARADARMIDDAVLIESTADLSMPMTQALRATLSPPPGGPP